MTPTRTRDALRELIEGIDKGAVKIESELIYDEGNPTQPESDADIACWRWHEEWLHHARAALAEEEREEGELVAALREIAELKGLCLLGPRHDQDGERLHELGSNKAFDQAAAIALAILAKHPSPPKAGDDR